MRLSRFLAKSCFCVGEGEECFRMEKSSLGERVRCSLIDDGSLVRK